MISRIVLVTLMFSLSGCVVSWDHDHEYTRTAFQRDNVNKLVIGSTTVDWITGTFGDPDSRTAQERGGELWKYENRGNRDVRFFLFPIIDVDLTTDQRETLSIRIDNDVVTDYWIINDEQ